MTFIFYQRKEDRTSITFISIGIEEERKKGVRWVFTTQIPCRVPLEHATGDDNDRGRKDALFDALHTAHVLPVRPTYTSDRPSGIIHECRRSARTNDNSTREARAAVRVCAAYAGDHALQRVNDVRTSWADVHSRRKRRARHAW